MSLDKILSDWGQGWAAGLDQLGQILTELGQALGRVDG